MTDHSPSPDDCRTMPEVRAGVDETDRRLVELLDRRFAYMRAAARIKTAREAVRDEPRKREVIENACRDAREKELPAGFVENFFERLVEASIAYELEIFDRLQRRDRAG